MDLPKIRTVAPDKDGNRLVLLRTSEKGMDLFFVLKYKIDLTSQAS